MLAAIGGMSRMWPLSIPSSTSTQSAIDAVATATSSVPSVGRGGALLLRTETKVAIVTGPVLPLDENDRSRIDSV